MLSYRHGFHAGNHADVLKHLCLLLALQRMTVKPKPLVYIDTHAGGGLYDPHDAMVQGRQEAASGLGLLHAVAHQHPAIGRYLELQQGSLLLGSPALARACLREQDRLILMELHNTEINALRANLAGERVAIHHRDGFEGLPALLPPEPARGLVLIDPSYEDAKDQSRLLECCRRSLARWAHGCYLVWYPVLSRKRDFSGQLIRQLEQLAVRDVLVAELRVTAQSREFGMCGSGMVILNPPWQLDQQLQELMPVLHAALSPDGQGEWSFRSSVA